VKPSHLATVALLTFILGCSSPRERGPSESAVESALSAAQCSYFNVDGKTQICHATSSATHP
jgi:hypothetical protein